MHCCLGTYYSAQQLFFQVSYIQHGSILKTSKLKHQTPEISYKLATSFEVQLTEENRYPASLVSEIFL